MVAAVEVRKRERGAGGFASLQAAVGAVLGGVLDASLCRGGLVYRSRHKGSFIGQPIGYVRAIAALDGLVAAGLISNFGGIRHEVASFDDAPSWTGKATRYSATDKLLEMAQRHGLNAENVREAFTIQFPAEPPALPNPPLKLTSIPIRLRGRRHNAGDGVSLPVNIDDPAVCTMLEQLREANEVLAAHIFAGCTQPRLYRAFRENFTLGGRWITAGALPIQQMNVADRLKITIDGKPVAEVDVKASHLSILAAFAGMKQIKGDPYDIKGPWEKLSNARDLIKAVVVRILGSGKLLQSFPDGMRQKMAIPQAVKMAEISEALAEQYPFLREPGEVLGVPNDRVALRLQFLEAEAVGAAMNHAWIQDVPAVPVHDSLIVPERYAKAAATDLWLAYRARFGGAEIQTEIELTERAEAGDF